LVVVAFGLYRALSQHTTKGPRSDEITFYITLAFAAFFLNVFVASRLVNREGHSLYLLALAPPAPQAILLVKAAFCALPNLAIVEAVLVGGGTALHLAFWQVLVSACVFAMLIFAEAGGLILIGLIWPKLDWDNPSRQVSTQANLYGTLGALLLTAGVLVLLLFTVTTTGPFPPAVYTVAIFAITTPILGAALIYAPRRFDALLAGER
jgi:hypothetical protein